MKMGIILWINCLFVLIFVKNIKICKSYSHQSNSVHEDIYNQCDNINKPICQGLQYQKTRMPNSVGIMTQEDSSKRMNDYYPLINAQCSHYFRFFLCTIYFPMCAEIRGESKTLLPCKNLCVYIQSRCEPYMEAFKLKWPVELSCKDLPERSTMCIQSKTYELDQNQTLNPESIEQLKRLYPNWNLLFNPHDISKNKFSFSETNLYLKHHECLDSHVSLATAVSNRTKSTTNTCHARCDSNIWYNSSDKMLARIWYFIWTVLCLFSSIVAIGTFVFDQKLRFMYPERPIIFMVLCYGCMCLFNLFQFGLERKVVVCQAVNANPKDDILMTEGFEKPMCMLTFLGMYYFEMVAALWWLMLAVSCYMASARKWSCEGLEQISSFMHMIAWSIPAVFSITILILHKIDADELLGSCYVGRRNSKSNLIFILIPRLGYFLLGTILLILSFKYLLILRRNLVHNKLNFIKDPFQNQQSLEKFIAKTGIFCSVYGIPMTCYIGCQLYYYMHIEEWNKIGDMALRLGKECVNKNGLRWSDKSCLKTLPLPIIEIRLLEIFSTLVIGITSGMWMWCNKKTLENLSKLLSTKLRLNRKEKRESDSQIPMNQTVSTSSVTSQKVEPQVFHNKCDYSHIHMPLHYNKRQPGFNQHLLICNV